ncbi:transposase [Streptomyces nojiriensis]|uniref:transposase n=1 Tax=Streptomyces nojiriensis TaxID=66374 RepID=UPI002E179A84
MANTAFTAAAETALEKDTPPVTHLGIDETRRGKAKFGLVEAPDGGEIWEVVADRWHVGLVDLVGGAGLLGQVEGRTTASASACIGARTRQWRARVQVVAIDMCTVFKAAVREPLPHVSTWWPQILAAITTGVTNAASAGINRAIKTDAVHLCADAL